MQHYFLSHFYHLDLSHEPLKLYNLLSEHQLHEVVGSGFLAIHNPRDSFKGELLQYSGRRVLDLHHQRRKQVKQLELELGIINIAQKPKIGSGLGLALGYSPRGTTHKKNIAIPSVCTINKIEKNGN